MHFDYIPHNCLRSKLEQLLCSKCVLRTHVHKLHVRTSAKSQDILNSKSLGFLQVGSYDVLGLVSTRDVEHRIKTTVVERGASDGH